ncbi:hypothetical protein [Thalassotalea atypica]|uniref:hypothetical protein n=1 Tax=Thalassotalea atypica TaxID=2054316 RepID=UPI0025744A82|nr:hypothetical protein [Thalassotalea atypica]
MNVLPTGNNAALASASKVNSETLVADTPKPDVEKVKEVANVKWQFQLQSGYYQHQQDLIDSYMGTESEDENQSNLMPVVDLTELYTEAYYLKVKKYFYDELKAGVPSPEEPSVQPIEEASAKATEQNIRVKSEYHQVSNTLPSSLVTFVV